MSIEQKLNGLLDREAAIDTVHRFVQGLDTADGELIGSTLAPDALMELRFASDSKDIAGRENTVATLMKQVGALDTGHYLSNFRVSVDGDSARLTCYCLSQHFASDEGHSANFGDFMLMGNHYDSDLVRTGRDTWLIRRLTVTSAWSHGNPKKVFGW